MRKQLPAIICSVISVLFQINSFCQKLNTDSLTVEKALSTYRLSNPVFSRDGKKLAFVVSQPAAIGKPGANHIWLLDMRDSSIRQYTNSAKSEFGLKWSPKGKQLAFLSNRNGDNQVFLLADDGGEAAQLTSSKTGVSAFEWNHDGKSIAYVEKDSATADEKKRKDDKYDENVVSASDKNSVLLSIDIATKTARRLLSKSWSIVNLKWMPSGDALVLEIEEMPSKEIPSLRIVKFEIKDSTVSFIASPKNPSWGNIEIAPGGKLFSFTWAKGRWPLPHDLYLQSFSASEPDNISGKSLDLPIRSTKFITDNSLTGIVQKGFYSKLYKISTAGNFSDFGIKQNVLAYDIRSDNTVAFVSSTSSKLQELWIYGANHSAVQLSHFNNAFEKTMFIAPELVTYKSFDGAVIESLFFKPANSSIKNLPMVVIIHGGPTGAFADNYNAWAQLFLQKGYAVMMPNIRGSTGYGWKFLESNRKDWGGGDFKDIMAGIDYMIANKNIDSSKLAIVGWSYGGYMSEWAITQTNRFKAAMSGAGLFNLASEFGTEGGAAYDNWCLGTPYENPEVFRNHSAINYIKNARTPTLIIQGEDDDVDPIGQSQELYRALRYYNVPAELVLYPREHHGFVELTHNIDYITRMIDWVEKYCPSGK